MMSDALVHSVMTLGRLLEEQPPAAVALQAPGRPGLDFRGLLSISEIADRDLAAGGIGRRTRIATLLRNGSEAASCFLALACRGTVAPLNPGLTRAEIDYVLNDIRPTLLLTDAELDSPGCNAARDLGIPVAQVVASAKEPAGWFRIRGLSAASIVQSKRIIDADDELLLLHTSGTTAKPK